MTQTHICSGLGCFAPCVKRDHCANYVHWTLDRRSEFNVCGAVDGKLRHFAPTGIPLRTAEALPQRELFA